MKSDSSVLLLFSSDCRKCVVDKQPPALLARAWRSGSSTTGALPTLIRKTLSLFSWLEDLERTHQSFVYTHHSTRIVEFTAVVGSRKERHQLAPGKELVAVLHDLVGTANEIEVVLVQELSHNVFAKGERDTPVVLAPSVNFLVGVRPEKIAQEARVGDIGGSDNALHLVEAGELGAETSVHAENLFVNDSGAGKAVEAIRKGLPQFDSEAALALVVKSVDAVDGGALVVAAENEEVLRVLDLVSEQ